MGMVTGTSVMRKQTRDFIAANPLSVILSRADSVPDGAGGLTTPLPMNRPVQIMRVIQQGTEMPVRRSVDGEELQPEFVLLGEHDADIRRGDWFFINGIKYEVFWVRPDRRYETWAEVVSRG